jgi:hypothetical protein
VNEGGMGRDQVSVHLQRAIDCSICGAQAAEGEMVAFGIACIVLLLAFRKVGNRVHGCPDLAQAEHQRKRENHKQAVQHVFIVAD